MLRKSVFVLLLLAVSTAAQEPDVVPPKKIPPGTAETHAEEGAPLLLRWMIHPLKRGMFVGLPIVDTDPNRGVTVGFMPIWVIKHREGDQIEQIHAPSLTYNGNFRVIPTYRYYYYPAQDKSLNIRGSISKYEREAILEFEDRTFLNHDLDLAVRAQYNVDAGQRFFGLGPDSPKSSETNFKEDYFLWQVTGGVPIVAGTKWRVHVSDRLLAQRVFNGPLHDFEGFSATFPELVTERRSQTNEMRIAVDFDNRDHPITTRQGIFAQVFSEHSVRGLASAYDFNRYGIDARLFRPWPHAERMVSAAHFRYEQLRGNAPFWLLPSVGGKYSLRAYGENRYIDRGSMVANLEQRFTFYQAKLAGVTTEFELTPFAGLGTVFDSPGQLSRRYIRPVFGSAIRAMAKPQVVGSIDFGVGQEGLAVFMDINYSF